MTAHEQPAAEQPRDHRGKWDTDLASAHLDRQAAELRGQGKNYREIAEELGISVGSAYQRVQRATEMVIVPAAREMVQAVISNLQTERGRLEDLRDAILADFERGRLIPNPDDPDGEAIQDPEYRLKAADRLIKIGEQLQKNDESLRRLQGLDQPAQQQVSAEVTYKIVGMGDE